MACVRSSGTSTGPTLGVTWAAQPSARGEHSGVRLLSTHAAVPDTPHSQFQLAVSISTNSGTIHVRAAGELDLATAASDLAALNGNVGMIEADLGGVTFIDLAGLRAILEARLQRARTRSTAPHHRPRPSLRAPA